MELRQLRYFCTIVEEGTIIKAAKKLNMTQPPLTSQMHQLEDEMNVALFNRDGRRLILTDAGKHLYDKAKSIIGMCDSAVADLKEYHDGTTGTLHLGIVSSVQGKYFQNTISHFHAEYPFLHYDIVSQNTYSLLELLENGTIDMAAVRTPFHEEGLEKIVLKDEMLFACGLPERMEGLSSTGVSIHELDKQPLIVYRRWQDVISGHFREMGLTPNIVCINDTAQMTMTMAQAGLGIGVIPESALLDMGSIHLIAYPIIMPVFTSKIVLVCKDSGNLSSAARLFWNYIDEKKDFLR